MTKTRQIWVCPRCGRRYESPAAVKVAWCPHPGRRIAMKLEEGENGAHAGSMAGNSNGRSVLATPPAVAEPPTAEEPDMAHVTRPAAKRKARA